MRYQRLNNTTLLLLALLLARGMAQGANLSGLISSTKTIHNNSKLTGDVTCGAIAPCIMFGAPNLQLNLNGHTITGNNGALDHCTGTTGGPAISTGGMDGATIQGPGIITQFQGFTGIGVTGNNSIVNQVVVTGTCGNGISVRGSNNVISSNSISRFSLSGAQAIGAANNGIAVLVTPGGGATGGNDIHGNEITGASSLVLVTPGPNPVYSTGFGIGILVAQGSNGNTIYGNNTSGNANGIFVWGTGNTISGNQALGNTVLGDIYDPNSPGTNVYLNNLCLQVLTDGSSPGAPACPGQIPGNLIGHQ
jgi:parallel beta-helix repeat protein